MFGDGIALVWDFPRKDMKYILICDHYCQLLPSTKRAVNVFLITENYLFCVLVIDSPYLLL